MDRDQLLMRIVEVLRTDGRVQAVWLGGSLGRGAGDKFSDVDLIVAVDPKDRDSLVEYWDGVIARVAPLVYTARVNAGDNIVFNHITKDWLRFDVTFVEPADMTSRSKSTLRLLFDNAGLQDQLRPRGEPLAPSAPRVAALTKEFMRVFGLLPVVLGRREYVVGASGAGLVRTLVIQLMLEDVAVEDRGGALHLKGLIPDYRLKALAGLPPIEATSESIIAVHLACAHLFLPLARELCDRTGTPWPAALAQALRDRLARDLGLEIAL